MPLKMETDISGQVVILYCAGRLVFGDETAAFRERIKNILRGTQQIVGFWPIPCHWSSTSAKSAAMPAENASVRQQSALTRGVKHRSDTYTTEPSL
jgi:hypothetical protein